MIIWITIKLANVYTSIIPVPVEFTHLPKDKVLTSVSDNIVRLEIKEKGSTLFSLLFIQSKKPAIINLRFTPMFSKNGTLSAAITTSSFINDIERDMGLYGKIQSISPDTIYLTFEPEKSKRIPVSANFDISYEKHYFGYDEISFNPDSVTVTGPERIIDMLDSASLGLIRLVNLSENISVTKSFPQDTAHHYHMLRFLPEEVTLTIPVEKFTEAQIDAPVIIINNNELRIKTFPDKVKVTYTVALKEYSDVEPGMITAVADFANIDIARGDKVRVRLEKFPAFIRINKVEPEIVEYIILK